MITNETARNNINAFWERERATYRPDDRMRSLEKRQMFGAPISRELANSIRRIAEEQNRPSYCVMSEALEEYVARYIMHQRRRGPLGLEGE
ncbi:hypothetical protein MYX75_09485 [Acidobacteria bacterium AH-259-A15]|nr:hypothetical protein [Acidobacteria bacterium AH-259-A15]